MTLHTITNQCKVHISYLYAGWPPGYELGQLPLPDPLQGLVDLRGVHLSLDDVEEGDVAVVVLSVTRSGHHHILGLERKEGRGEEERNMSPHLHWAHPLETSHFLLVAHLHLHLMYFNKHTIMICHVLKKLALKFY